MIDEDNEEGEPMSEERKKPEAKKPDLFTHASMHVAGNGMREVIGVIGSLSCVAHNMRMAVMLANVPTGSELDSLTSQLIQNVEASSKGIVMLLRKIDEEMNKLFPGDGTVNPELPPTKH